MCDTQQQIHAFRCVRVFVLRFGCNVCLFVCYAESFFCWLFIFEICSPFSHTINFNQFKIIWIHIFLSVCVGVFLSFARSHRINCETQSHDNAERKMAFWVEIYDCLLHIHGAHNSAFLWFDDDAHHFLHNLWPILLEIRSEFSASFQSHFHQLRASVCMRVFCQGFLHTKQMMNIWFVFSHVWIWDCNLGATKSFAYIWNIYILMLLFNLNAHKKTYILRRRSVFSAERIGSWVSVPKRCKYPTKDFIRTHKHTKLTHYFQHMRKTTRRKFGGKQKKDSTWPHVLQTDLRHFSVHNICECGVKYQVANGDS